MPYEIAIGLGWVFIIVGAIMGVIELAKGRSNGSSRLPGSGAGDNDGPDSNSTNLPPGANPENDAPEGHGTLILKVVDGQYIVKTDDEHGTGRQIRRPVAYAGVNIYSLARKFWRFGALKGTTNPEGIARIHVPAGKIRSIKVVKRGYKTWFKRNFFSAGRVGFGGQDIVVPDQGVVEYEVQLIRNNKFDIVDVEFNGKSYKTAGPNGVPVNNPVKINFKTNSKIKNAVITVVNDSGHPVSGAENKPPHRINSKEMEFQLTPGYGAGLHRVFIEAFDYDDVPALPHLETQKTIYIFNVGDSTVIQGDDEIECKISRNGLPYQIIPNPKLYPADVLRIYFEKKPGTLNFGVAPGHRIIFKCSDGVNRQIMINRNRGYDYVSAPAGSHRFKVWWRYADSTWRPGLTSAAAEEDRVLLIAFRVPLHYQINEIHYVL